MSIIEKNVMASVAAIYAVRLLMSPTAIKLYVVLLCTLGITFFVSVGNVIENLFLAGAGSGMPHIATFMVSAISDTTALVQGILIVGMVAATLLFVDIVRTLSSRRVFFI